jgi:hypothetical protein
MVSFYFWWSSLVGQWLWLDRPKNFEIISARSNYDARPWPQFLYFLVEPLYVVGCSGQSFFSFANNFHEMVRRSKARPEVKLGRRRRMLAPKK